MSKPNLIAGYKVLARIGTGAASKLYAVQDPKSRQVWALKHVIKEDEKDDRFLEQTINEYEIASKLDHPHIRKIPKLIRHRQRFKLTAVSLLMELIDAQTLDERLPRTPLEATRIFAEVAGALAHMHEHRFVHADMKPSNVLVTGTHHVKIIDLGQACKTGTVKKRIQGTPGYMAPEQAHRQAITPATDIYNLGAMMYWVLVGEVIPTALPPKDGSGSLFSGAIDADFVSMPTPPDQKDPRIHTLLSRVVMDCIQLEPEDRPESMATISKRLELIGDLIEAPPATPPKIVDGETQH